jgi:UDP-glucose 4-epimerase
MKSIVTGGCGFIGSHLVDQLVKLNHEVIVLDRVHPKHRNPNAQYYLQDLSEDYTKFSYYFEGVNNVFHLASEVSIPYCVEKPNESMSNNTLTTMNVLEASRLHKVNKFIFSSTSAVYGNSLFLPSVETNPVECLNTYSISKHTGEELCKMYYKLYGLKTIIFRYFNVYGERQHKTGQYAPVMSIFMRQKKNSEPLSIVGDGYQTRDFIHVLDIVRANILASQKELDNYGEVFNVGTGTGVIIKEIADLISDYQIHIPERPGEVLHSRSSIDKIKQALGWNYTINVLDWIKNQVKLYGQK